MIERKKICILAKTYPTLSEKYDELVCTAGLLEDGSWIRIYPLPFRKLEYEQKYKKYQWIEADVERNPTDPRVESCKVFNIDTLKTLDTIGTDHAWDERNALVFRSQKVYTNLDELIVVSNADDISLAIFKPTRVLDFIWKEVEREWPKERLEVLKAKASQLSLFQSPEEIARELRIVQKLPYKFSYVFEDDAGKQSTLMVEDWEVGMLYWNCLETAHGDETQALEKVRQKCFDHFVRDTDFHFFMGTTKEYHGWALNPFIIVGLYYPPKKSSWNLYSIEE
jgi:hypothetical protein